MRGLRSAPRFRPGSDAQAVRHGGIITKRALRWSRNDGQKKAGYFFWYGNQNQWGVARQTAHTPCDAFEAEALRLASKSRSTQAVARQLDSRPKLRYRWRQAQLGAEVGSKAVAPDPEVRALRARLKRAEQALDMLKKALVIFGQSIR